MKDFAIDTATNSFLRKDKGFRFTGDRLEYLAQMVWSAVSLFLGEWYLNAAMGIPYIPKDGNKTEHLPLLEASLQTAITGVEGVIRLTEFNSDFDRAKRTLSVRFVAETDAGILERGNVFNAAL
jgi:hypothetical protein